MNWNQQRTNEAPNPVAGNPNIAKVYLTGVYVRLSVEDGGLGKESESLLHQEQFLMRYLEQHPELILTKIYRDAAVIIGLKTLRLKKCQKHAAF